MAAYAYVRPSLGLVAGGEYQPLTIYPEAPGAVFNAGDFLQIVTTGTITLPTPAGSLATFVPTSAPTLGTTASSGNTQHTLFAWYSLAGSGGAGVLESQLYPIGPVVNTPGNAVTVNVPADGNYPVAATHFLTYVGTLPGQMWLQSSTTGTALGSSFTIPAYPLTNNTGVNRSANNPASGIVGYANYQAGTGLAQREGDILGAGYNWRALFGVDQSLSGNQSLLEQYRAQVTKLANVPVVMSVLQAYSDALIGTTAGIVFSTQYQAFYADTTQTNSIFYIDRKYGGAPGPYNPIGGNGDTGVPVVGHFIAGLA
jgi:hypothetical protein